MLEKLIDISLRNRAVVVLLFLIACGVGLWSLLHLPLDAFPDTTPVQVQIDTTAPALGPEEIETQISLPVELSISGLPGLVHVRSISKFGLSQVVAIFKDEMAILDSRQLIMERLAAVELPDGIERPELGPISTGLGEVFHYTMRSTDPTRGLDALLTLHDWVVKPELRKVPGVAEVNAWGGLKKQYHVIVEPQHLIKYGLRYSDVATALRDNNLNVGGGQVTTGGQTLLVHGLGRVHNIEDIGNIAIFAAKGAPVRIRDVARIEIGHELRRGAVSADANGEVILGLGFMLMGENSREVTAGLKQALERVSHTLPEDIVLETVYDRTDLVNHVITTAQENLGIGALLVVVVLFVLLGNIRAGLLVAATIPIAMLFAAFGMGYLGIAASLLSLGAIDFGILVDGSVVMTEANLRHLSTRQRKLKRPLTSAERLDSILLSSREVVRPVIFGLGIIALVFIPVLTLEGIEGKMFKPMAWTFVFALLGALAVAVFLTPVLSYYCLPHTFKPRQNRFEGWLKGAYTSALQGVLRQRRIFLLLVGIALVGTVFIGNRLGGEFLPRLSEGSVVVSVVRLAGVSVDESVAYNTHMEQLLLHEFPDEIRHVWSRIGSAEIATDPMGVELTDIFITLYPRKQWRKARNQTELSAKIEAAVHGLPGIRTVLSQPIELRVNEMLSGIRGDVGVKIFGPDFNQLVELGEQVEHLLSDIPGTAEAAVEQITGQPTLQIEVNREALARHGVSASEVLEIVAAVGTPQVGKVYEGERSFPLVLRLPDAQRNDPAVLAATLIPTASGALIPLQDLAHIHILERPSTITREWGQRLVKVDVSIGARDIASYVAEARAKIDAGVKLPSGYRIEWGGQFENLEAAQQRLSIVVPLVLLLIFVLLYFSLKRLRDVAIIYTGIPLAAIGGVIALSMRSIPFSVSAAIGFIALAGIAVLNGQILVGTIHTLRQQGTPLLEAVTSGARLRLIPVLATAITDAVGFLPMALSTGIGAEVQRPLATVVVGGVLTSTLLTLFVLPVLYLYAEKAGSARDAKKSVSVELT